MSMSGTAASTKVWRRIGVHAREALLRSLTPLELRAILVDVARTRAAAMTPAEMIRRWREDRYFEHSEIDPREALPVTGRLWAAVPREFIGVSLSQVTPLGTGIHLGGRGQNRIVTTMRGSEVLVDPAHGLALEASKRRRSGHSRVHLATHARCTHEWDSTDGATHEVRFSLVSSAPDGGGLSTEADLIDLHLDYWREIIGSLVPQGRIELTVWDHTLAGLIESRGTRDDVIVVQGTDDERRPWRNPYTTAAFRFVAGGDEPVELGDGGFVTWTQALTRNRKDRCIVSGISIDALVPYTWGVID